MDKLPSSRVVLDAMLREGSVDLLRRQVIESVLREEEDELKRQSRKRAKEVLERFCVGADRPTALREVRRRLAQSKVYLNVGESVERALDQVEKVIKKKAEEMIEGIAKGAASTGEATNSDVPKPVFDAYPVGMAENNGSSTPEPEIKVEQKEEEKPRPVKQDLSALPVGKNTPSEGNEKDVDKHATGKTALDEKVDAAVKVDVHSGSAVEGSAQVQDDRVVLSNKVQDPLAKAEPEHVETPVSGSRERGNSAKEETLLEKKNQWQTEEEREPTRIQPAQPAEVSLEEKQASEPQGAALSTGSESGNTAEKESSSTRKRKNVTQKREKDDTHLVAEPQSPKSKRPSKAAGVANIKPVPDKGDTGAGTKKVINVKNIEAVSTKPAASMRPPRERRRSSKFGGDEWESDLDKLLRPRSTSSTEKSLTATPVVELNSKDNEALLKMGSKSKPEDKAEPVDENLNGKEIQVDEAVQGNEKLKEPKSASKGKVENLAVEPEPRGRTTQSTSAPPSQDTQTRELRNRSRSQTKNLQPLAEKDAPTTQVPKVLPEEQNAKTAVEPGHSAVIVRKGANTTLPTERGQEAADELKKSSIQASEKKLKKTPTRERRNVSANDMNPSDLALEDNQEKKTDTRKLRKANSRDLRTSFRGVGGKPNPSDSGVVEDDVKKARTRELRSTRSKGESNSERVESEQQPKNTHSRELKNPLKRSLGESKDAPPERHMRKKTITRALKAVSEDASDDKLADSETDAKIAPLQTPKKSSSKKLSHSKVAASEESREKTSKRTANLDSGAPVMGARRAPTREVGSTSSNVVLQLEPALISKNLKKAPTREDKKSALEGKETPKTTELSLPTLEIGPEARTSAMEFTVASPTNTGTPQTEPDSAKRRSGRERTVSVKLNDIGYQGKGSKTPKKRILADKKSATTPEASLKATLSPPSGTSMSSALKKAGKKLIGIRVKISLPRKELQSDTKRWYFGTIVNYEKLRHVVAFDADGGDRAGDTESFNLDEEEFALIAKRA